MLLFQKNLKVTQLVIPEGYQECRIEVLSKLNLKVEIRIRRSQSFFQAENKLTIHQLLLFICLFESADTKEDIFLLIFLDGWI